MIAMTLYEYLRYAHFNLEKGIREIHKETGKDRKTIRKALAGKTPAYHMEVNRAKPVMDEYLKIIEEWLLKDKEVPKKQRHTATRIYHRLKKEYGFKGGQSTVIVTVNELKKKHNLFYKESYIPSDPERRRGAEIDWGDAAIEIQGIRTLVHMFCMRPKYSGKMFVKLYPVMVQECFFNGHIEAFAYYGGVFSEMIYDNLSSAVKKVLTGHDRLEQESFLAFRAYYCFNPIFCNVGKGSEKGGVEGLVKYARQNFLTPIPKCDSLKELNKKLLEECRNRDVHIMEGHDLSIGELFEKEKDWLLPLPSKPYENYKLIDDAGVDKYQTIRVDNNRYSVPSEYVGCETKVELGLEDVRITYHNKVIATHQREFRKGKWVLNPWHYFEILRRKSRAFKSSRILSVIENDWAPAVKRLWEIRVAQSGEEHGTKEFLDVLLWFREAEYSDMVTVIELAIENNTTTPESIKLLYETLTEPACKHVEIELDHLEKISGFCIPEPDLNKFDMLIGGSHHG